MDYHPISTVTIVIVTQFDKFGTHKWSYENVLLKLNHNKANYVRDCILSKLIIIGSENISHTIYVKILRALTMKMYS